MILLIYGSGGLGREIYDLAYRNSEDRWEKIIFVNDFVDEGSNYLTESIHFDSIKGRYAEQMENVEGIVAVGEPVFRQQLLERFKSIGLKLATIIDASAIVSPSAKLLEGVIVAENALVHAEVEIGEGTLIQPYACIGHGTIIGNYSVIGPHSAIGGSCKIDNCAYVGMNSSIKEKVCIAKNVIVGMSAAVFTDVEEGKTVVGNPARATKRNNQGRVFNN